jgi:hypothetical protein
MILYALQPRTRSIELLLRFLRFQPRLEVAGSRNGWRRWRAPGPRAVSHGAELIANFQTFAASQQTALRLNLAHCSNGVHRMSIQQRRLHVCAAAHVEQLSVKRLQSMAQTRYVRYRTDAAYGNRRLECKRLDVLRSRLTPVEEFRGSVPASPLSRHGGLFKYG